MRSKREGGVLCSQLGGNLVSAGPFIHSRLLDRLLVLDNDVDVKIWEMFVHVREYAVVGVTDR